jgi:N-acetylmuramoyl-L-alanine amidase
VVLKKKQKIKIKTSIPLPKTYLTEKTTIKEDEGEYYKVNIADITKNDNTISYGSIVSAKPLGYKDCQNLFPCGRTKLSSAICDFALYSSE